MINFSDYFTYNDDTGLLSWAVNKRRVEKGQIAGHQRRDGYIVVGLNGKLLYAHHIIWGIFRPEEPLGEDEQIDHINHIRHDNRLCNLRKVKRVDNMRNQSMRSTNPSGVTGVRFNKECAKWQATIRALNKEKHLGVFANFEDAVHARKAAEVKYGFHENHGKKRGM